MFQNILAFDSACKTCSVCYFAGGTAAASFFSNSGLTHSQTLLPAIEKTLAKAGRSLRETDCIALTAGPGSFTGLKIGAATAKGLAFANQIPCVPVSTLTVLAYGLREKEGILCPVLDARRNLLYNALFTCRAGRVERITADRQISVEDLKAELSGCGKPVFLAGDGMQIAAEAFGKSVPFTPANEDAADIRAENIVAAVLAGEGRACPAEKLVPAYLRPSQAEQKKNQKEC